MDPTSSKVHFWNYLLSFDKWDESLTNEWKLMKSSVDSQYFMKETESKYSLKNFYEGAIIFLVSW